MDICRAGFHCTGKYQKKKILFSFRNGRINERKTFIGRRIECLEKWFCKYKVCASLMSKALWIGHFQVALSPGEWGESSLMRAIYRNVPSLKVWFLCRFGLESVSFWGATGVYGSICYFNSRWIEKERVLSDFNMDFKKWFCWPYILINDDTISAYARSENGCGKWPLLVWNRAGQDLEGRVLKQG